MPNRPGADARIDRVALGLGLAVLLGLEFTPVDLRLAQWAYDPATRDFPWRLHWLTTVVAHDGLRWLAGVLVLWVVLALRRPTGVLRRLDRRARLVLVASVALCLLTIALAKRASFIHCPWDLSLFGGYADYVRLFDPRPAVGKPGRCFPAGHASAAFAFFGGWFALRGQHPAAARVWLGAVLAAGAVAAIAQQLRGAHFLSHALWTAWLCYALSATLHHIDRRWHARD